MFNKKKLIVILVSVIIGLILMPVIIFFVGWFLGWLTSLLIGGLVVQGWSLFGLNVTPDQIPILFGSIGSIVTFIANCCKSKFDINSSK